MYTPLSWISLYTPLESLLQKEAITTLAHRYSIHTAEIDSIITHDIEGVVIGKVITAEKYAKSNKLVRVEVDLGSHGTEVILTGAENVLDARYVPVARIGAKLGKDFIITERKMAGMMSRGMICSIDELGLQTERSEGIMILEEFWEQEELEKRIGTDFFDLKLSFPGIGGKSWEYTLQDTIFEIDNKFITNRPDLFSIVGNAREWQAIFDLEFHNPLPIKESAIFVTEKKIQARIETPHCFAYSLLEMHNISPKISPGGIQIMLHRAGLSCNLDLVDITNLICVEYGQPMHVFDREKVVGDICVRMANAGEKFHALNDITYTLSSEDIVIADQQGVLALAGIIGGMESAVSDGTSSVIWESGTFDPQTIRLSAQRHGIRTDASTRYEKSLDPTQAGKVFPRLLEYLHFLKKEADIVGQFSYLRSEILKHPNITISSETIDTKAGVHIPKESVLKTLTQLGFDTTSQADNKLGIMVPSWRATKDVAIEEDIVEEILRIYGYDAIPLVPMCGNLTIRPQRSEKNLQDILLQYFARRGWNEVYNYSFTNASLEENLLNRNMDDMIRVVNAYTKDYTHMRGSLAPWLLTNIADNLRHSPSLAFFEIGKIYGKNIPFSQEVASLLQLQSSHPYGERKKIAGITTRFDTTEFRRELETLFWQIFGYIPPVFQDAGSMSPFFHPGISGCYRIDDMDIALFGRIHPNVAHNFGVVPHTCYFEMDFEQLNTLFQQKERVFRPISPYQAIPRELNFVLEENVKTGEIARFIFSLHPWITRVFVDSVYRDVEKIGEGHKSVNFSFSLQSMDATISDNEAQKIQEMIIAQMQERGYALRSL